MRQDKRRIVTTAVYLVLLAGIAWQFVAVAAYLRPSALFPNVKTHRVSVQGNVRRPGMYRVPEGTTEFEILKVAGVRPTSDLSPFTLSGQVNQDSELRVGTLDKPAAIAPEQSLVRLEFYHGEINLISSDGRSLPLQEGLTFSQGDRIQTEASSQAEVSIGPYSRVDLDNFSEIVFDKVGAAEGDKSLNELFHKSGFCWYKLVYTKKEDLIRILTSFASVTAAGSGADLTIDAQPDFIQVNLMEGLLLVERIGGTGEAINLISDQTVTIFADGRPFQVTRISSEVSTSERFSQLAQEKSTVITRHMPLNLLFCGIPTVFYVINVDFESGRVNVVPVPNELLIGQFAQSMSTIDQAYLYGGPVFVSTMIERILDLRVPKYCVFGKDDIIRTAGALGGLPVNVDSKAAGELRISQGRQKLNDQQLVKFLSASISGPTDAKRRQAEAISSIFEGFSNKSVVLTALLADQILSNIETNFVATEVMSQYNRFASAPKWQYSKLEIPGSIELCGNRQCIDPDLERSKTLLKQE